jgi:DNA-directed RNA polymerase specialized sigma24 family protein
MRFHGGSRELDPAFEDFVRARSPSLLRTAFLLTGDRGHAEDLLQTTLLRVAWRWRAASARPDAYARRVLVNLSRDRWRNLSRRVREGSPSGAQTRDGWALRSEMRARLHTPNVADVTYLPPDLREEVNYLTQTVTTSRMPVSDVGSLVTGSGAGDPMRWLREESLTLRGTEPDIDLVGTRGGLTFEVWLDRTTYFAHAGVVRQLPDGPGLAARHEREHEVVRAQRATAVSAQRRTDGRHADQVAERPPDHRGPFVTAPATGSAVRTA